MKLGNIICGALLLGMTAVANAGGSYFKSDDSTVKTGKMTSSKPVITNYKGKLVAIKYRDRVGSQILNCPQGVISFSTIERSNKGEISAMLTYRGGTSTLRGQLNNHTMAFEGALKANHSLSLHIAGQVFDDRAEGSVWFKYRNNDGLCLVNFTVFPQR